MDRRRAADWAEALRRAAADRLEDVRDADRDAADRLDRDPPDRDAPALDLPEREPPDRDPPEREPPVEEPVDADWGDRGEDPRLDVDRLVDRAREGAGVRVAMAGG